MNDSILDEKYVTKDIEMLKFYAEEEKRILVDIVNCLYSCNDCYNTQNNKKMISIIDRVSVDRDKLYNKRNGYINELNKAVVRYKDISDAINNGIETGDFYG